ncbi:hypothetical protein D6D25_05763 [Aureobasidium pullulans]|nr:hypothetical protein D6D25_05763 [Aureobasidium pullulans]
MPFAVKALDHIVLTCKNVNATVAFYTKRLGMQHEVFRSSKDPPGIERYNSTHDPIYLHLSFTNSDPTSSY